MAVLVASVTVAAAQDLKPIPLPQPRNEGGKPLMQALKERRTIREISPAKLPLQTLSDLLWAGFGVNRPQIDHRTAPSAMNSQEIEIYVATADGVSRYDAKANQLLPVTRQDIRLQTGSQPFVTNAPVALIFVADFAKMEKAKGPQKDYYSAIDTGFISQNVYLYCASEGLATVVHDLPDRAKLGKALQLKPDQKIVLAQAVGFPQKP